MQPLLSSGKMKIALDFDDTYTHDPVFWDSLIALAQSFGHDVRFVSYRIAGFGNQDIESVAGQHGLAVHYTGGVQKETYCRKAGWVPDIWIDDSPVMIPTQADLASMAEGAKQDERLLEHE